MISEKDIEDYWEHHVQSLLERDSRLVARQYVLPSGRRADLVFMSFLGYGGQYQWAITVVELKADKVDIGAVAQLVEYLDEMRGMAGYADLALRGVLVGRRFTPKALMFMRQMPHIRSSLWGFDLWSEGVVWSATHPWGDDTPGYRHHVDGSLDRLVSVAGAHLDRDRRRRLPARLVDTPKAVAGRPGGA